MAGGNVMAGFPNPLPDTLHLFLVGFSVYTCVFGRAYAIWPGCTYLLVELCRLRQPFTPVHSSRARTVHV